MPVRAVIQTEFRALRRELYIMAAALVVAVLAVGWTGDYRSCQRQQPTRQALKSDGEISLQSAAYWQAKGEPQIAARLRERAAVTDRVHLLSCLKFFPGT